MTVQQALEWIHSTPNFARSASLDRIRSLTARLGNPQNELTFVHIAGTNGKGSTAAMTAEILRQAGYRTGLYTSPYLQQFSERIRLNGANIPDADLARLTERVRNAVCDMEEQGEETPNEFERVTALALLWYREQNADLVVLEVGLGGRYDATNVIPPPAVCAITSISRDHTAVLGADVAAIAREKSGIMKPGSRCVMSFDQPEPVREVIRREANAIGCELIECRDDDLNVLQRSEQGMTFCYGGETYRLPLMGDYQAANADTVLHIIEALRSGGIEIPQRAVREGLSQVNWPGRLELLGDVLLDCGHNPGGIAALCRTLDAFFSERPVVTVMGMLRDKDFGGCIRSVAERSAAFFAVSPPSPRALAPEEIAAAAEPDCSEITVCGSVEQALAAARKRCPEGGLLVVCGSIPLVGECRTLLSHDETRPNP